MKKRGTGKRDFEMKQPKGTLSPSLLPPSLRFYTIEKFWISHTCDWQARLILQTNKRAALIGQDDHGLVLDLN